MKKFITVMACAAFVLVYSNTTNAQESADANVSVTILSTLNITNLGGNLDFGDVFPLATATVDHEDGVDFRIDGANSSPVIVSFTPPSVLIGPGLAIPFSADFRGNSSDDATSATSISNGATVPLNSSGNYYLWLGGEITPGNIYPGIYEGTFTVSVAY